jgi:hypothetical protein
MPDYGRLKTSNTQTKFQQENQAAFQTLNGLITAVQENENAALADTQSVRDTVDALFKTEVVEIDSSSGPVSVTISDYVGQKQLVVFKDATGTASGNNITLVGTVDGAVDPVISTDYGIYRVFLGLTTGAYHQW